MLDTTDLAIAKKLATYVRGKSRWLHQHSGS